MSPRGIEASIPLPLDPEGEGAGAPMAPGTGPPGLQTLYETVAYFQMVIPDEAYKDGSIVAIISPS